MDLFNVIANDEMKLKRNKKMYNFGLHCFGVKLYNFGIQAISENNINALSFLNGIGVLDFIADEKEVSLYGEGTLERVMREHPNGKFKLTIPREYLNQAEMPSDY